MWPATALRGDRYFDFRKNYKGQITFFSAEVFEKLCANFGITDKSAGVLRRNVIVSGVDLLSLIGQEFEIQGVRFRGTQHCAPCEWMDQRLRARGGSSSSKKTPASARRF